MKVKIILFFRKIILRILPLEYISNWIENDKINKFLSQITIGENSKLYESSSIQNTANDRNKIVVGKNTHIRGDLIIWPYSSGLYIGDNCYVGKNTQIWSGDKIIIYDNVLISHNVTIIDSDSHELNYLERASSYLEMLKSGHPNSKGNVITKPIIIHQYAWISYGVSILKGVTIGEGAIVGAGSVVTRDIPPYVFAAGNPAKIIRKIEN